MSRAAERRIRLWWWSEVAEWLAKHDVWCDGCAQAQAMAAVNGALALFRHADPDQLAEILAAVG